MFAFAPLAAFALAAAPAPDEGTPIAGAWRLLRHLPTVDHPMCVARAAGTEANMDILLNRDGEPILIAARPDWELKGEIDVGLRIDGEPERKMHAQTIATLVLVPLSDPALVERLRRARTLEWSMPFGRFHGNIAEFGAAVDAVKACKDRDDKAAAAQRI